MKPLSFSSPHRSLSGDAAFTLIELLVVISIIALLAGLLLPVVGKVTENARKVSAKSTETQVVSSISNYQTDYGVYPVLLAPNATPVDTSFGPADGHNFTLFNALRAIKLSNADTLNSRQVVYFEGKNVKNNGAPKDGFILEKGGKSTKDQVAFEKGDLVDPWGNAYLVRMDSDYNNVVSNPYSDKSGSATADPTATDASVLRLGSICYSYGLDGDPGLTAVPPALPTYSNIGDDVVSWQ